MQQRAGAVAVSNEEAVRAWDTVLYERWKSNRRVFVGALDEVTEEVFGRFPPPVGGCCIDIGCGFGDTTQRLAELVGAEGFALGTDSSAHFIEDARSEAKLRKLCWRRKAESPIWAGTEKVVQRFLSRPEEYDADTCGPGPFSLGNPETTRGILEAAGFSEIELEARDFDYFMGSDMDEAIDSLLAIGPGAELIRLNGEYGESRRDEIAEALREHYAPWQKPDGSIIGRGSVWLVTATNPS
jgi:SAM-dependent methyltransferase